PGAANLNARPRNRSRTPLQGIMGAGYPRPRRGTSDVARSKSSSRWLKEHFDDPFVRRAQAEGWRSRAAFKLAELIERDRLLQPGRLVVDLGAAPGAWSQMAREKLGDSG